MLEQDSTTKLEEYQLFLIFGKLLFLNGQEFKSDIGCQTFFP